jgi:hypothetical protein
MGHYFVKLVTRFCICRRRQNIKRDGKLRMVFEKKFGRDIDGFPANYINRFTLKYRALETAKLVAGLLCARWVLG